MNSHSSAHFGIVQPLLTDYYQLTMAYTYWVAGKADEIAVFEALFRKNPFNGEYTIFAGLNDCVEFLRNFKFREDDIAFLKTVMPANTAEGFFDHLRTLDSSKVTLWSVDEGTAVFPREPVMWIRGPVIICQLLESAVLNLINFASLVTTNATRFRLAAGADKKLFEFGIRRAQGPDGGLSASRYAYLGGFDATSNVLAGKMFNIPLVGTHAHSFVTVFSAEPYQTSNSGVPEPPTKLDRSQPPIFEDLSSTRLEVTTFLPRCQSWLKELAHLLPFVVDQVNPGELVAFATYAVAFPNNFVALLDTYNVLRSGLPSFCAVTLGLYEHGYKAVGVRIDSGDLAYLSRKVRNTFKLVAKSFNLPWFEHLTILISNDLSESTLHSLNSQLEKGQNSIDAYCVGTNLVTCKGQPSLGCVYKLVDIGGRSIMKLTAEPDKMTMPGHKAVYRLYGRNGDALVDLITKSDEDAPVMNERILCRHPLVAVKRVFVNPASVRRLLNPILVDGKLVRPLPSLKENREYIQRELTSLRSDYKRHLNPTPYKVSLTEKMYRFLHDLLEEMSPIDEFR